jgi:hypothetical protein
MNATQIQGELTVTAVHPDGRVTSATAALDIAFMFEGLDINVEFAKVETAREQGKWRGIDVLPDGWNDEAIADLVTFRL